MSNNPVDAYVGRRLHMRRTMLGMSQDALGKLVGVTFQQIQKYEHGSNRIGSGRLYDFAKILNVPVSYFYEEYEESGGDGLSEDQAKFQAPNALDSRGTLALVGAFNKIKDPVARDRILGLIKALGSE